MSVIFFSGIPTSPVIFISLHGSDHPIVTRQPETDGRAHVCSSVCVFVYTRERGRESGREKAPADQIHQQLQWV